MGGWNPFDEHKLGLQVSSQRQHAWSLEDDIEWSRKIDTSKPFLPLDADAIAFPGASAEQRLALSQWMGLVINSTVSEMESVINKLRDSAWARVLREYPVNPEMEELGVLFFEEEEKHSRAFNRFNRLFCSQTGIDPDDLDPLLPRAWGSHFLHGVLKNANAGGGAFWWAVATVEEVSIQLYKDLHQSRHIVDPLYYELHLRHLEEESRHRNYAFLMLEVMSRARSGLKHRLLAKTDLLTSQVLTTGWVLAELQKIHKVRAVRSRHPFFEVLASALPLLENFSGRELLHRLFVSAPYLSVILNTRHHKQTMEEATRLGALGIPFPEPALAQTRA